VTLETFLKKCHIVAKEHKMAYSSSLSSRPDVAQKRMRQTSDREKKDLAASALSSRTALLAVIEDAKKTIANGKNFSLTPKMLNAIWSPRFGEDEVSALIIPLRTLARRKAQKSSLNQEETDRAMRLAYVISESDRVFGNIEKSSRWLRKPNRVLNGQTPLSLLKTETGTSIVKNMLGQIDHGMFA
jgi:putative toxin-antitoxin system antitoxin component (TIGR02293 family)